MGHILQLAKSAPLWGAFSTFSLLGTVTCVALLAKEELGSKSNEIEISILDADEPKEGFLTFRRLSICFAVSVGFAILSSAWLWEMAQGRALL
jgi:hypothetical protein